MANAWFPNRRPAPAPDVNLVDEARIVELDELVFKYKRQGDLVLADAALDRRNEIRPARPADMPVIPGRSA